MTEHFANKITLIKDKIPEQQKDPLKILKKWLYLGYLDIEEFKTKKNDIRQLQRIMGRASQGTDQITTAVIQIIALLIEEILLYSI